MKTDRELLELAAKAAGLRVRLWEGHAGTICAIDEHSGGVWMPLHNDGDALRLAVMLYLWEEVRLAHRLVSADIDIYAATRRSIVRAAAAIGENMK